MLGKYEKSLGAVLRTDKLADRPPGVTVLVGVLQYEPKPLRIVLAGQRRGHIICASIYRISRELVGTPALSFMPCVHSMKIKFVLVMMIAPVASNLRAAGVAGDADRGCEFGAWGIRLTLQRTYRRITGVEVALPPISSMCELPSS